MRPADTLTINRIRDLRRWREAAESLERPYYTTELMLALYDHAPALLDAAEERLELLAEVSELRARMNRLKI